MELGFLLVAGVSAAAGFALRAVVGHTLGRVLLGVGLAALLLGLGVLTLSISGRGPLGFWGGGVAAVVLLGAAALVLPFALVVTWRRP